MSIWVIGGTSGIGFYTAKQLREEGHEVYATGAECEVRDFSAIRSRLAGIEESSAGSLQGIVYSAGTTALDHLGRMGLQGMRDAHRVLDTNLFGFINVLDACRALYTGPERPLRVVAVSSDAATRPMRTSMAYCASKAGLDMAVKVAARELGPFGWRINAVSPGMTAPTGMSAYIDSRVPSLRGWSAEKTMAYERMQEVVPGRIHPNQVAKVIIQTLLGPDHLNGSIITLNGGR